MVNKEYEIKFKLHTAIVSDIEECAHVAYRAGFMDGFTAAKLALHTIRSELSEEEPIYECINAAEDCLQMSMEKAVEMFCNENDSVSISQIANQAEKTH